MTQDLSFLIQTTSKKRPKGGVIVLIPYSMAQPHPPRMLAQVQAY